MSFLVVRKSVLAVVLAIALHGCSAKTDTSHQPDLEESPMGLTKVTPVLLASDLEPCVEFWSDFGFEVAISVPYEDELAFVSLQSGSIEIMYQSFPFSEATNPVGIEGVNRSVIYLEADSLDEIVEIAAKYETVIPDHKTPHGSREIYVRDPAGNLIGFAQQGA